MHESVIVELLRSNWGELKKELGDGWPGFRESYVRGLLDLGANPSIRDLDDFLKKVLTRLKAHPFGRGLLRGSRFVPKGLRRVPGANETLKDEELVGALCNSLTDLAREGGAGPKDPKQGKAPSRD